MPGNATSPDLVAALVALLEPRWGIDRAIPIADIASRLGLGRRATEQLLETCLPELPWPVVSGPAGYHRPADPAELNRYLASLQSRLRCIAIRSRTVRRQALTAGWQREGRRFVAAPAPPPSAPPGELFPLDQVLRSR